jgi:hypothetical protein
MQTDRTASFIKPWFGPIVSAGPALPLAAMMFGMAVPLAADAAYSMLTVLTIATILAGMLALPPACIDRACIWSAGHLALRFAVIAPALAWLGGALLGADGPMRGWMALAAAAPVGSGAIAAAGSLGIGGGRVACTFLLSILGAPLVLPWIMTFVGGSEEMTPIDLALRLGLLAAAPATLALLLRRRPSVTAVRFRQRYRVAALIALMLLALARTHGVGPALASDPAGAARLLMFSVVPSLAGVAAACFWWPVSAQLEGMLAGGFRNVAVVWAACAATLPAEGGIFMALTALPVYATPVGIKAGRWLARHIQRSISVVHGSGVRAH